MEFHQYAGMAVRHALAGALAVAWVAGAAAAPATDGPAPRAEHRVSWLDGRVPPLKRTTDYAARATELMRHFGRPTAKAPAGGYALASLHDTGSGPVVAAFLRRVDGVPVYGSHAALVMDRDGMPIALTRGGRPPGEGASLEREGNWRLSAERAARSAFPVAEAGRILGARRYWVESDRGLEPAWRVDRLERDAGRGHPVLVGYLLSARDGRVLDRASLTDDYQAFEYRVYADADGEPTDDAYGDVQPHPTGMPDGYRPTTPGPRPLVTVAERADAHDDPWLPDGATETVGNNADVFFNSLLLPGGGYDFSIGTGDPAGYGPAFAPGTGDFRAAVTAPGVFDYPYDLAASPGDFVHRPGIDPGPPDPTDPQLNAKIVQAFYGANYLHDFFYDAGFDEAAGNAQQDNFGRGGTAGDPVIVHAGFWTTVIFTPGDGVSPVIHMGRNTFSASNRDATLDFTVFAHEWAHYMVRRLVGGGAAFLSNNQGGSLNEGWADFVGLFMAVEADDGLPVGGPAWLGTYAVGAYMNQDYFFPVPVTGAGDAAPDSYYYGIRRYPYSQSPGSNPLNFRHIEHGAELPAAPEYYDWKGRSRYNSELHTAGEVWAVTLWDCYLGLLKDRTDLGFQAVRERMAGYLVAGMKATPVDPVFTEARDALLAAMRAADPRDYETCRVAFATRGMGAGAIAPPRDSMDHAGVVESFDTGELAFSLLSATVDDSRHSTDGDGVLDDAERGYLRLDVRNTGYRRLNGIRLRLVAGPDYRARRRPVVIGRLEPGEDASVRLPLTLTHDRDYDPTEFRVTYAARATGGGRFSDEWLIPLRTHFDVVATAGPDTFEFPEAAHAWTVLRESGDFSNANPNWERAGFGGTTVFQAAEGYAGYVSYLVSPEIQVATDEDFVIEFDHAFDFLYTGMGGASELKGNGRVEISTDGSSWTTLLDPVDAGTFVSPGYPALSHEVIDLGRGYAGQAVRLRFGGTFSETFQAYDGGWFVDNVTLGGVDNLPLLTVVGEP